MTQHPVAVICRTLWMARQTAYYATRVRPAGFYRRLDDETVVQQIRAVTNSRATYGYRRVWAMVNRTFRAGYNRKRIRRLMRMHDLMLPPRVHRRHGRPHLGQVQQPASNQRWCSDIFLIPCWSGEVLSVAFAIDCHDREVFAWTASPRPLNGGDIRTLMDKALWARFGETVSTAPHAIQWLSDNGPQYTATASVLYAHELGLVPITTPSYSPESNGLAEGFVHTFKRDYVNVHELRDAESVLAQLRRLDRRLQPPSAAFGAWHAAARRVPGEPRTHAPICLRDWGADQSTIATTGASRTGASSRVTRCGLSRRDILRLRAVAQRNYAETPGLGSSRSRDRARWTFLSRD